MTKDIATVKAALESAQKRGDKVRNALDFIRYGDKSKTIDGQALADAGNNLSAMRSYIKDATDCIETALSSPPAIDLEALKEMACRFFYPIQGRTNEMAYLVEAFIDHLDATGRLARDELTELLKRVPEGWDWDFSCSHDSERVYGFFMHPGDLDHVICGEGTTPAEAVRKALDTMKDHPNGQ